MKSDLKAALLGAYARLLRPLVRILLRNGITYQEFSETAKRVFVTTVARDLTAAGSPISPARIAIQTGLTRQEVERVLEKGEEQETTSNLNRITRVLTGWHTDAAFTGPYGLPLELQFEGNEGADFSSLVTVHCPDASAGALLQELLRIGAVRETDSGWYRVLTRTYLPKVDVPDSLERIGQAVQYFVETIDFNRQQADPDVRLFERTVYADDGIQEEDLPRFKRYVRERAQVLLEDIDNWLSQLDKPEHGTSGRVVNTGLGIYHYVERPEEQDAD